MKMSDLVGKYIELRDKKAEYKKEYENKVSGLDDVLTKIEGKLLETFNASGVDSIKTEAGTAYRSTKSTASVADKEIFLEFVRLKEEWPLLEIRCNKTAVEQFKAANEALPPGCNWREEITVNVRRSA